MLEEQIAQLESILSKQEQKLESILGEISSIKEKACPVLGDDFISRLESSEDWNDVGSASFNRKYIKHEVTAVSKIAALRVEYDKISEDISKTKKKLETLDNDRVHNNLQPGELFGLIREVKEEFTKKIQTEEDKLSLLEAEKYHIDEKLMKANEDISKLRTELIEVLNDRITMSYYGIVALGICIFLLTIGVLLVAFLH
mmetsp:Transcript_995/g.1028  ORF Transcript_995/g.1028 Transcript_995/m.1028 type:complete len:200 (+) Transcript_995:93-692(+)